MASIKQHDSILRIQAVRQMQLVAIDQIEGHLRERVPDPELLSHKNHLSSHRSPLGRNGVDPVSVLCRASARTATFEAELHA
jgi:hypothetical protein